MLVCRNCGRETSSIFVIICHKCGETFPKGKGLPSVGSSASRGIYRITFAQEEGEFSSKEAARAVVPNLPRGKNKFCGEAKVEFVRSTVTPKTHPFECGTCKASIERDSAVVSPTDKGSCSNCGKVNWLRRTT